MNPLEYQAGEPTPEPTTPACFWARHKRLQLFSRISKQNRPSGLTGRNRRSSATLLPAAIVPHTWPGSEYFAACPKITALFAFLNIQKEGEQLHSPEPRRCIKPQSPHTLPRQNGAEIEVLQSWRLPIILHRVPTAVGCCINIWNDTEPQALTSKGKDITD